MKLDKDIQTMDFKARGRELMRLRSLIRTHKKKHDNARCWHNDETLYQKTLPEGSTGAGKMTLPEEKLLQNCRQYIRRQQCADRGCSNGGSHHD